MSRAIGPVLTLPLVVALVIGCGGAEPAGPGANGSSPPAGSRASAKSNSLGIAVLKLGEVPVQVSVSDQAGRPLANVMVGATVGDNVVAIVASDPSGKHAPALRVLAGSQVGSSLRSSTSDPTSSAASALLDPLSITLFAVGFGLSVWELVSDPLHHELVLDDGILKSCVAGDLNDLMALLSVPASVAGNYLIVSILEKSKAFALIADAGFTVLSELLSRLEFMDRDRLLPGSCIVLVGDANFSLQLVVISAVTGGGIFAQDNGIPSSLFFVEASSDGQDYDLGPIRVDQGRSPPITDMAVWDSLTGNLAGNSLTHPTLYAVSFDRLYRLNRATGAALEIGGMGNSGINALAFDAAGNLFAAGQSGQLLTLDRSSGAVKKVIQLSPSVFSSGDLAFLPDGRLVATVVGGSDGDLLVEINPLTGAVRMIGAVGVSRVYGLSFFGGKLWGLSEGRDLMTLNLTTGRATIVRTLDFRTNGASLRE